MSKLYLVLAYTYLNHIFLKYVMVSHYIYIYIYILLDLDSSFLAPNNSFATKIKN